MDDVIYEEFKGTGNMEIHLDRRMAEKRTHPAIKSTVLARAGRTAAPAPTCCKGLVLRKLLYPMDDLEATEFWSTGQATKNNAEFFDSCARLELSSRLMPTDWPDAPAGDGYLAGRGAAVDRGQPPPLNPRHRPHFYWVPALHRSAKPS
jgi:hypothetical protein